MKAQFRNLPFGLFLTVAVALFTEVAARANAIDTGILLTPAGGSGTCEVGLCDSASLQNGAINQYHNGNANSIPSTPFNFNYTFAGTTDKYNVSGSYVAIYNAGGTTFEVFPTVEYLSNGGSTNSLGDALTLDFLQDFFDDSPGTFNGTYVESAPLNLAAKTSVTTNLFWDGQAVGALGPFVGPGTFNPSTSNNLTGLTGNYLDGDFQFTFTFAAGATPGTAATLPPVPEPAQTVPAGLALIVMACIRLNRKRSARLRKPNC